MFSKKMVHDGLAQMPSFSSDLFWRRNPACTVSTTRRDALVPLPQVRHGEEHHGVGHRAVGDPVLWCR